ncbi:hypothetical protein DFH06DRAFT_380049 [Mycena polygramma]|nr:hypothetical protein DFH06DRAFT_380049 [Mycena polygramma]
MQADSGVLARGELRERLAQLESEIEGLRTKLSHLASARDSVLETLNLIVYPILTLPNEITAEIFLHYVSNPPRALHLPDSYRTLTAPPLLASVCRVWRHVALNLQAIWSNIRVDSLTKVSLLQCCIARAGRHPLVLAVSFKAGQNVDDTIAVLAPYSAQWETFKCRLPLSQLGCLTNELRGCTPLLRKLMLECDGGGTNHRRMTAFSEAPQLREVDVSGHGISIGLISLPWAQLTHLTCRRNNPVKIVEMLHRTTHLEKLVLFNPHSSPTTLASSVLLPYLHTLELLHVDHLADLGRLTLPALKTLAVEGLGSSPLLQTLLQLLARSGSQLRSTSLAGFRHTFVDRILNATPAVTDVRVETRGVLDMWSWDDHLIPFFQRLATDVGFLPNLQTLHMKWSIRAVPAQAVEMLEARWAGGSRKLKSFKLRCEGESWDKLDELNKNAALRARLQALRADGMEIEIPGI